MPNFPHLETTPDRLAVRYCFMLRTWILSGEHEAIVTHMSATTHMRLGTGDGRGAFEPYASRGLSRSWHSKVFRSLCPLSLVWPCDRLVVSAERLRGKAPIRIGVSCVTARRIGHGGCLYIPDGISAAVDFGCLPSCNVPRAPPHSSPMGGNPASKPGPLEQHIGHGSTPMVPFWG